jgi:hypothetical protein
VYRTILTDALVHDRSVWIALHWHATLTQSPIPTAAVTDATDTSSTLSSSSVFVLTHVCLHNHVSNFMLLNVLVGKLYRHFRVRNLVGHSVFVNVYSQLQEVILKIHVRTEVLTAVVMSYSAMYFGESPTIRRNISHPSLGWSFKPIKKPAEACGISTQKTILLKLYVSLQQIQDTERSRLVIGRCSVRIPAATPIFGGFL